MSQTRSKIKEIIEQYKKALLKLGIKTQKIVLFGSHAKGTPRKDSDIDLIVVSKDFKRLNLRERLEILGIAAARIMKPVEAIGYTPQEIQHHSNSSFLKEVLN